MNPRFKILFLCTGNSARSIFAECLLRKMAGSCFDVYSAGANPKPAPHPMTIEVLHEIFQVDASDARSKSWEEFKDEKFDFVVTLCDDAKEMCPVWTGRPIVAHWGSPDPVEFEGSRKKQYEAFRLVAYQIKRRLDLLTSLPFEKLDDLRLEIATREIGQQETISLFQTV